MPWLWSNPQNNTANGPDDQAKFQIHAPDIGHLVAAIMQDNRAKQQQQQQGISNAFKGITSALGGVQQGQSNSSLSDFMHQAVTDQSDSLLNDPQISDLSKMSPQDRSAAMSNVWHMQANDLANEKVDDKANLGGIYTDAGGNSYRYGANGQLVPITTPVTRTNNALDRRLAPTGQTANDFDGVDTQTPGAVTYWNPTGELDTGTGSGYGRPITAEEAAKNKDAVAIMPDGNTIPYKLYPYIQQAHAIRDRFTGALPAPDLPQLGLPQGQSAPGVGEDGRIIPGATSPATTPIRQGAGPTDSAIAYLREHPELASQFDAKYGQGLASTFLNQ